MIHKPFQILIASLVLAMPVLATAAPLQSETQNEADLDFASKLVENSLDDLAVLFLDSMEKRSSLNAQQKARIQLIRAELLSRAAEAETDLTKKIEIISNSVKTIEEFLKNHPTHPSAADAKSRIGELGRSIAEAIVEALQSETDPKRIEELRAEGEKRFKEAEEFFRKQISEREMADPVIDEETNEVLPDAILAAAYFNVAKTYYRHSLIYPKEHSQHKFLQRQALEQLDNLLFDFGNFPPAFKGFTLQGQVYASMGDWEKAKNSFEGCLSLGDYYINEAGDAYEFDAIAPIVLAEGFVAYTKAANQFEDYATTIEIGEVCFDMLGGINIQYYEYGWEVLLEQAKALAATGQYGAAQEKADLVVKYNSRGPYGKLARELSSKLLTSNASCGQLVSAAEGEMQKGNMEKALIFLQKAVRAGQAGGDNKCVPQAYWRMGFVLNRQKRYEEAVLAFQQVASNPDTPKETAPKALYQAADTLTKISGLYDGSPFYDKMYVDAVNELGSKYADSPEAPRAQLLAAKKLEAKGNWTGAYKIYTGVKKDSVNYDYAQVRAAYCIYMQARSLAAQKTKNTEARKAFLQAYGLYNKALGYFEKDLAQTIDVEKKRGLLTNVFTCLDTMARIKLHRLIGKPKEALDVLKGREDAYTEDPEKFAALLTLRVRALIDLGRLSDASSVMDVVLSKAPKDLSGVSDSCRRLAAQFETEAQEKAAKGNVSQTTLKKAKRYYEEWIQRGLATGEVSKAQDIQTAADRIVAIGALANGLKDGAPTMLKLADAKIGNAEYWDAAAGLYSKLFRPPFNRSFSRNMWRVEVKMGQCMVVQKKWQELATMLRNASQREGCFNALNGQMDRAVVSSKPGLLGVCAGLGLAYYNLGKVTGNGGGGNYFQQAIDIFVGVYSVAQEGSELWWQSRFLIAQAYFDKGDYCPSLDLVESINVRYPDYDDGKYGFKGKFASLKAQLVLRCPK